MTDRLPLEPGRPLNHFLGTGFQTDVDPLIFIARPFSCPGSPGNSEDLLFGGRPAKPLAMIRAATIKDVRAIHALLQIYAERGELLSRPMGQLYDHVRDFVVAVDEQSRKVIGCCALQIC
jgi:hypothetical protein